ncbi:hypothetical protein KY348_02810 [Candidatus Woesearchaeota archaeon]|nr:hypothetical protein [Candidatus Woesearchaeota archaeon]
MPREKTLEENYDDCISKGYLNETRKVDVAKIKSNIKLSDELIESARDDSDKQRRNAGYDSLYDALHNLVEAFLAFDKVRSSNHQCLFAWLCYKHPELELDWSFFERIRTRRNGINYYGEPITKEKFNQDKLGFKLYANLLKNKILKRLKSNE